MKLRRAAAGFVEFPRRDLARLDGLELRVEGRFDVGTGFPGATAMNTWNRPGPRVSPTAVPVCAATCLSRTSDW